MRYEDLDRDARIAAIELDAHLREPGRRAAHRVRRDGEGGLLPREGGVPSGGRGVAGSRRRSSLRRLSTATRGVVLDAILFTAEDVSIILSFTRSTSTSRSSGPASLPRSSPRSSRRSASPSSTSRSASTSTARPSCTARSRATSPRPARRSCPPAATGPVMTVFTLPGLDVVFKVIKDEFKPPKQATRREVMDKYRHVFRHDRAGRLVDAQEFEHCLPGRTLLAGGPARAQRGVRRQHRDRARRDPCSTHAERRDAAEPLHPRRGRVTARQASRLRPGVMDLAATNTFPGDLLLKNFGGTRHGRVIFYDYDELQRDGLRVPRSADRVRRRGDERRALVLRGRERHLPGGVAPSSASPDGSGRRSSRCTARCSPRAWREIQGRIRRARSRTSTRTGRSSGQSTGTRDRRQSVLTARPAASTRSRDRLRRPCRTRRTLRPSGGRTRGSGAPPGRAARRAARPPRDASCSSARRRGAFARSRGAPGPRAAPDAPRARRGIAVPPLAPRRRRRRRAASRRADLRAGPCCAPRAWRARLGRLPRSGWRSRPRGEVSLCGSQSVASARAGSAASATRRSVRRRRAGRARSATDAVSIGSGQDGLERAGPGHAVAVGVAVAAEGAVGVEVGVEVVLRLRPATTRRPRFAPPAAALVARDRRPREIRRCSCSRSTRSDSRSGSRSRSGPPPRSPSPSAASTRSSRARGSRRRRARRGDPAAAR